MFRTFFQPISSAAGRAICAAARTIYSAIYAAIYAAISTAICLLSSALLLTACSPGTGGTGTGPIASSATPVISSTGSFESSSLPVGSTTVFSSAAAGSAASSVSSPCAAPCPVSTSASATSSTTATLQLEANSIQLTTPCSRFVSSGAWRISAAGELSAQGSYQSSANGSTNTQSATLSLSFGSAGLASSSASATVKDSAGKALLGPLVLTPSAAGVGAAGALAVGGGC